MKQTAVEKMIQYFIEQKNNGVSHWCINDLIGQLYQAKQMEKEQMIGFAKNFEHIDINKSDIENELNCYLNLEDTEELLKENFKSE